MKTLEKNTLLNALENVYATAKDSRLEKRAFTKNKKHIDLIQQYFQVNTDEALLIAIFFIEACLEEIEIKKIVEYVGLKPHEIFQFMPNINALIERQIISKESHRKLAREDYSMNKKVIELISKNLPLASCFLQNNTETEESFFTFLDKVDKLSETKDSKEISQYVFVSEFKELIENNVHFPLVNYIHQNLKGVNAFLFIDTIIDCVKCCGNNYNTGLETTIDDYYNSNSSVFQYMQKFLNGETVLNRLDLIEKDQSTFSNRHSVRLTNKSLALLKEMEGIEFEIGEQKNKKLTYPTGIQTRKLFYNTSELQQLSTISKTMSAKAFSDIQSRLITNNMTPGITILLYGSPGTGKTETVYQLAKKYKRAIFKVDISETKSMWFGESQKLVKKIFTDYAAFRKKEKNCPILLFNEADAVLGKRKAAGSSGVADTENAIQNILLEELETFDGILFATTNLTDNLDSAFERRFLFKVKFSQPSLENAAKIWKAKLPYLATNQTIYLAQHFTFSGGQMENIAKKCIFNEILQGEKPSFDDLKLICEQERWINVDVNKKLGY